MALVSVLIPAYNAEGIILRALDSARSQTISDIEIIVVDDASTDGTVALVEGMSALDARIRLLKRGTNGGPAAARNMGLYFAEGEWIALLDADDAMQPQRLEHLLARAGKQDVLVADNLEMYDFQAQQVARIGVDPALIGDGLRLDARGYVARCRTNQPRAVDFGLLKPLIRASHLRKHSLTYDETARHGEDFRFYLDALLAGGSLLLLPEAYYRYTERTGSISGRKSGVSQTNARYDQLEADTRTMAADPRYSSVTEGLHARADALRSLAKVASFRRQSNLGKLARFPAALADPDMRTYIGAAIRTRLQRVTS